MTFHADFWVVLGTAAPVIALSSILVLGDLLKLVQDFGRVMGMEPGPVPVWEWPFSITTFWYLVAELLFFFKLEHSFSRS